MSRGGSRSQTGISDEEILELFRDADRPFQTATDVADAFGIERQSAHRRLQSLHDDERLNREKVGARAVVWWLPERDDDVSGGKRDPFMTAETFSSGRSDVSESVDEAIAAAAGDESDT